MVNFKCICGGTAYFRTGLRNEYVVNQIYCPKCGLMMFSPEYDKDGVELKRRWQKVMSKDNDTLPFSALTHPNMEALDKRDRFLEDTKLKYKMDKLRSDI